MSAPKPAAPKRYGPASFIAAVVTMTVVQTVSWVWLPYWILNLEAFALATLVVVPIAAIMTQARDKVAQVGRGMLIGYLATPLTIAIAIPAVVIYTVLT
jgi:ABC-type multidrug transport system permease subunit